MELAHITHDIQVLQNKQPKSQNDILSLAQSSFVILFCLFYIRKYIFSNINSPYFCEKNKIFQKTKY